MKPKAPTDVETSLKTVILRWGQGRSLALVADVLSSTATALEKHKPESPKA